MVTYLTTQLPPQATKIRFEEPYVSDGLNLKPSGIIPVGIYQGFDPVVNGSILEIHTESGRNDSVAVVETPQLHNLTVRVTEKYSLDLSDLLPEDYPVDVVIRAVYGFTSTPPSGLTDAKILVLSPGDVQPSDVRICRVISGGPPLVVSTSIPTHRNDNGGFLPTSIAGGFQIASVAVPPFGANTGNVLVPVPGAEVSFVLPTSKKVFIWSRHNVLFQRFDNWRHGYLLDGVVVVDKTLPPSGFYLNITGVTTAYHLPFGFLDSPVLAAGPHTINLMFATVPVLSVPSISNGDFGVIF